MSNNELNHPLRQPLMGMFRSLWWMPRWCAYWNEETGMAVFLQLGHEGYTKTNLFVDPQAVNTWNKDRGITQEHVGAMLVGSMMGWSVPGAIPTMEDADVNDE